MSKTRMQSLKDRVRQRAEEKEQTKKGGFSYISLPEKVEFFEIAKGTMLVDIVPYEVKVDNHPVADRGELWYERTFFIHREIGAENRPYICPLKTIKKPCPICEYRASLIKDGYDKNKDLVDALRPKERQLFNIDTEKGIKVFESSYYLFGEALEKEIREGKEEWAAFADLEEGYTLRVRFGEKTLGSNTFFEAERIDFEERDPYNESILDEVVDLDACLKILSYDELNKIFMEVEESEPAKEKEEAGERSRSSRERHEAKAEEPPSNESRRRREPAPAPIKEEAVEEAPTRRRREPAQEKVEEAPKAEPATRRQRVTDANTGVEETTSGAEECPGGGTFAVDCDKLDHCPECPIWEACRDEADKAQAPRRRR